MHRHMSKIPVSRCVTVSIVSHGQWHLAAPLLDQLERLCGEWIARVVLTRNLPEELPVSLPMGDRLTRIDNPSPRGFGANHNAAFAHCESPWFLVLNPDIRLHADPFADLLGQASSRTGLVAPRVREPGKPAPEFHRRLPTPLELWRRRLPGHRPPTQPAWVPGMFMLLRREAYQALGGFDARYHMYCEDVDLCARLQLAGWELHAADDIVVGHDAQRASNRALKPLVWHVTSLLRLWTTPAFWQLSRSMHAP
jgi:GT2 family glycosyltransferase